MDPLKCKWRFIHIRKRSPFLVYIFMGSVVLMKKDIGIDYRCTVASFADYIAIDEEGARVVEKRTSEKLRVNPSFLLDIMQVCYADHAAATQKWEAIKAHDFARDSSKELAKWLNLYVEIILPFGAFCSLPFLAESHLSSTVQSELEKVVPKAVAEWFNVAADPLKEGLLIEEKEALLHIAVHFKQGEDVSNEVKEHTERYSWMKNVGYFEEYYDEPYYLNRIRELAAGNPAKELHEMKQHQLEKEKKFGELLQLLDGNPSLQLLVRSANESVFFRSYRTEIFYRSAKYVSLLFKRIGEIWGLSDYRDILYLLPYELISLLEKNANPPLALIAERKKAYAFYADTNGDTIIAGDAAIQLRQSLGFQSSSEQTNEIKGQPAFMGKVSGKAVVVYHLSDLPKVKKGDILVAHATNIDYVPVLRLVSAIVTEEGGILSHASIISRELKIPAVIGTKNATKILKDGDQIEVDATKGIVRRLS